MILSENDQPLNHLRLSKIDSLAARYPNVDQ